MCLGSVAQYRCYVEGFLFNLFKWHIPPRCHATLSRKKVDTALNGAKVINMRRASVMQVGV